jgi:hypothetical protein
LHPRICRHRLNNYHWDFDRRLDGCLLTSIVVAITVVNIIALAVLTAIAVLTVLHFPLWFLLLWVFLEVFPSQSCALLLCLDLPLPLCRFTLFPTLGTLFLQTAMQEERQLYSDERSTPTTHKRR